ncbi:Spermidine/putrescine import ABC transporter substrate-binding protein PotD (TC 3.A.1.11.1) [Olavius algarvensis Delta 1 endosymbiont]|nr:Spermidine/putrescine import ABC transporter substrate-binding protein PotD (TC 3.A.1.11.1) [Olavius algarvensis Delta 1 endosymbiont]
MRRLYSYKKGSISRREFLGTTGLGLATAVMAMNMPGLMGLRQARAASDLGNRVSLATWPNYHDPENFRKFTEQTGVHIQHNVFGSNEEMLAKVQAGGSPFDVMVITNYTISTYVNLGLIEPLDLSKIPNFTEANHEQVFIGEAKIDGTIYAVPKNWGTTGYIVNTKKIKEKMNTWKQFWDLTMTKYSGGTIVHDYQLTTIGNALKYFGYSFNSVDPKELAEAEKLLIKAKPHLFAITSDYQPAMRNGDAWMTVCWTGDASQLHRDMPEMQFVLGREGGEIWTDFYAIPKSAEHREAAYALTNFLLDPAVNAAEVKAHGYPATDKLTNDLLPKEMLEDPIMYPAKKLLDPLEFGAAATLTSPLRAEVMARFKSA